MDFGFFIFKNLRLKIIAVEWLMVLYSAALQATLVSHTRAETSCLDTETSLKLLVINVNFSLPTCLMETSFYYNRILENIWMIAPIFVSVFFNDAKVNIIVLDVSTLCKDFLKYGWLYYWDCYLIWIYDIYIL